MALFVDRARSARPDFQMNAADEAAVIELLHLVSGMPLAIELAASRMRNLAPQALLKLLASGESRLLDVLGRGGAQHNTKQRHASMRHVVDWSWRQLGPELVELMAAMVTFAAPARIEAVAAVAGLNLHDTRERLEQLCDCSLVQVRDSGGDTLRYVLLQPVREFAAERVAPEVGLRARARLRTWLVAFGRDCHQRAHRAITDAQAEMPQIYAAIQSAAADHALAQAVDIALAFRRYWEVDTRAGLPASVTQTLDTARQTLTDPALRCELCVLLCFSHSLDGETKLALALAQEALDLAPDARLRAHALMRWAQVVVFSGGEASGLDATLAQALTLAHDVGDLEAQALALRLQFVVAGNRDDDHVRAEALAFQAQTLWERLGHRRNAYGGLMDRASCWIEQRRLDEAATALATCEQVARQEQHATGYITSSWQLGRVAMRLRQSQGALAAFRRCVHGSWQHLRLAYVADALVLVPGGLALTGQWETAARLQGFAVAHWQAQFGPFYAELERDVRFTRRVLLHCLGATRMEQLRLEGTCLSLPQAVSLALDGKTGQEAAQGGF